MKAITFCFVMVLIGCNNKISNNESKSGCSEIPEIIKSGWVAINDGDGVDYECKKGFAEKISVAVNNEMCAGLMDKDSIVELMGLPVENCGRAMGYFRMVHPKMDTSLYYTICYECASYRKTMLPDGEIRNTRKNIFFLIDKKGEKIQQAFHSGL